MLNYLPLLIILTFFSAFATTSNSILLEKRQVCDDTWALCYPVYNSTWYHYNTYKFIFNHNNSFFINNGVNTFDLHLLINTNNKTQRTIKSWYNLTNDLTVQVADDWFPSTASSTTNTTWTMYAYLLPRDSNLDLSNTQEDPYVQFHIVQFPPPIKEEKEKSAIIAHKWILAVIVIACVVVILAICASIWLYKDTQKKKQHVALLLEKEQEQPAQKIHKGSILSTPDALMIADTFRQVMLSSSTSDYSISKEQKSRELLKRQLQSEGTAVSEVERRTSSTKSVVKK